MHMQGKLCFYGQSQVKGSQFPANHLLQNLKKFDI